MAQSSWKLSVAELVKKFPALYGTRQSVLCLQAPATYPCTGPNEFGARPLILHLEGASIYQDIFGLPSGVSCISFEIRRQFKNLL